ncbi:hypothetical protein BROUX41_002270 [Berkeleyomyces rouxiae]|uniref:uncharacterized protein n=1 Tax=Berkeleyomyces rouxiae TaxID=2035830 RepID=UPI003B7B00B6
MNSIDSPSSDGSDQSAHSPISTAIHTPAQDRSTPNPAAPTINIHARVFTPSSPATFANKGLQRSIALVLKQVGFDSATPQALDSFAQHVEIYLESLINNVHNIALGARRDKPTPNDFQLMLQQRNLPIWLLNPHRKHPIPQRLLELKKEAPSQSAHSNPVTKSLPILHPDLSGETQRASMEYIPSHFPEFPSIHTFRYTPRIEKTERDSQKIRAAAALAAKQGEDALRGLVRAAKVRKQKEVRSIVQRESHGRERYRLWEAAMQKLLSDKANRPAAGGRTRLSDQEIADASMIVNASAPYLRQELPRTGAGKRSLPRPTLELQGP